MTKHKQPRRQDRLEPTDCLHFIELPQFTKRWEKIGLDDEQDLSDLQIAIMSGPKSHRVVQGTAGLRKIRFAPPRWRRGKSGAARVLYVYFEEYFVVLLCIVFTKNEAENISDAVKAHVNKLIAECETELDRLKTLRIAGRAKK